ncbi:unnamed protein product [Acanthoscelides obtectus]|uniref:Zinc finger BED domain-containing protein 5 n=1 Tax=Acanthoscelides obtectus TaxID=200917 RepID=A0A9P0LHP7_ACAOB|nr:unnamed protein product [Acanthoscelides obtectus]CAK1661272.1 Zinc finger BED domain-containing protein 5 [Acanthoscelides obtectus]
MESWLKDLKCVATKSSDEGEDSKEVRRQEDAAIPDQDGDATTSISMVSKPKKRKYNESYISFVDSNGSPLCLLCSKLLSNTSMVPAKMRRHLETVHYEFKDKKNDFFLRKKEELLRSQKTMMHTTQTVNEKAMYLVSYRKQIKRTLSLRI